MSGRKYPSGSTKRKIKEDKEKEIKKLPRIDAFFSAKCVSISKAAEKPEEGPVCAEVHLEDKSDNHEDDAVIEIRTEVKSEMCVSFVTDRALFPDNVTEEIRENVLSGQSCRPLGPFPRDHKNRSFSTEYYSKISKTRQIFER